MGAGSPWPSTKEITPLSWGHYWKKRPHQVGRLVKCELTWGNALHWRSFIICEKWKIGRGKWEILPWNWTPCHFSQKSKQISVYNMLSEYTKLIFVLLAFLLKEIHNSWVACTCHLWLWKQQLFSSSCRNFVWNIAIDKNFKMYILLCWSWIYWKKEMPITQASRMKWKEMKTICLTSTSP